MSLLDRHMSVLKRLVLQPPFAPLSRLGPWVKWFAWEELSFILALSPQPEPSRIELKSRLDSR
jgi:hypothetical protein